jgi:hypothetical protein
MTQPNAADKMWDRTARLPTVRLVKGIASWAYLTSKEMLDAVHEEVLKDDGYGEGTSLEAMRRE